MKTLGMILVLVGIFLIAGLSNPRRLASVPAVTAAIVPQQVGVAGHNLTYPQPTPAGYAADKDGILQALTCMLVQCPFPNCVGDAFLIQGARDIDGTHYHNGIQVGWTWGGGGSTTGLGGPYRGHSLQLANTGTGWRLYFDTQSTGEGHCNSGPAQFADPGSSADLSNLTFTFNLPAGVFVWKIQE